MLHSFPKPRSGNGDAYAVFTAEQNAEARQRFWTYNRAIARAIHTKHKKTPTSVIEWLLRWNEGAT
jgi:hypothetical protein